MKTKTVKEQSVAVKVKRIIRLKKRIRNLTGREQKLVAEKATAEKEFNKLINALSDNDRIMYIHKLRKHHVA